MSALAIVLDEEGPFRPGQKVRGAVEVHLDAPARCEGLALIREWRAHGKGEPFSGSSGTWELFVGDWEAGEQRVPFTVKLPKRGPVTYHGELLQVDWYLRAEAELAPGNLSAERTIEVRLPEDVRDLELVNDRRPDNYAGAQLDLSCLATPLLTVALGLFYVAYRLRVEHPVWGLLCAVLGLYLVGFVAFRAYMREYTEFRLGLLVDLPERGSPGGTLPVEVTLLPRGAVVLERVQAKLLGFEFMAWKEGSAFQAERHVVFEEEQVLCEDVTLQSREPLELYATFQLPQDAPFSFHANGAKELVWQVDLAIDVAGRTDWADARVVVVGP